MNTIGRVEARAIDLINHVKAHPELYKNDENSFKRLPRTEKQYLWDMIAKQSGFVKTEDAKSKWACLNRAFKLHLENVARKKVRRYIPKTGNPNDNYVQLTDWCYYPHLKFMTPYIKINAKPSIVSYNPRTRTSAKSPQLKDNTMKVNFGNLIVEIEVDNKNKLLLQQVRCQKSTTSKKESVREAPVPLQLTPDVERTALPPPTNAAFNATQSFRDLSTNDQNLKVYFDAMLRSTQRLPRFHQERVKLKLLDALKKSASS